MADTIRYAWGNSWLGAFIVAASTKGIVAFEFGDRRASLLAELHARLPEASIAEDATGLRPTVSELAALVDDPRRRTDLALDLRGADVDQAVWETLRLIPAGRTLSYGNVAARLGSPYTARDVAEACAANPIAILVPCHRVVRSDGTLAGYRWGAQRKRALLAREHANVAFELT